MNNRAYSRALTKTRKNGAAVTFQLEIPGTHIPATDTFTSPSTVTVPGFAVEIPGDPEEYAQYGLTIEQAITLFFVPYPSGVKPELQSTLVWSGTKYTLAYVVPIRPDGDFLGGRLILKL